MGVTDLPTCRPGDIFCLLARAVARRGVYSTYAQTHIVQAQYFRDHTRLQLYYEQNKFLTVINGEVEEGRNETFRRNLLDLENLVMIMFAQDRTVVPKESSWFGSYAPPQGDEGKGPWWREDVLPMREQPLYKEDWIGLREARTLLLLLSHCLLLYPSRSQLDETARVALVICEGEHMQISRECYLPIITKYVGKVTAMGSVNRMVSPGGLKIQR